MLRPSARDSRGSMLTALSVKTSIRMAKHLIRQPRRWSIPRHPSACILLTLGSVAGIATPGHRGATYIESRNALAIRDHIMLMTLSVSGDQDAPWHDVDFERRGAPDALTVKLNGCALFASNAKLLKRTVVQLWSRIERNTRLIRERSIASAPGRSGRANSSVRSPAEGTSPERVPREVPRCPSLPPGRGDSWLHAR